MSKCAIKRWEVSEAHNISPDTSPHLYNRTQFGRCISPAPVAMLFNVAVAAYWYWTVFSDISDDFCVARLRQPAGCCWPAAAGPSHSTILARSFFGVASSAVIHRYSFFFRCSVFELIVCVWPSFRAAIRSEWAGWRTQQSVPTDNSIYWKRPERFNI